MDSADIPQADSLVRLRNLIVNVDAGLDLAEAGRRADLSERHTDYYARAAKILGLLDKHGALTELGLHLVETPEQSPEERGVWEAAITNSRVLKVVVPNLLGPREPAAHDVANRIASAAKLAPSTALRRAETLLRWRKQLRQLPLFMQPRTDPTARTPEPRTLRPARARLQRIDLERFKGFREASLQMGSFTVVVGTNASGKSNLRDALRFLHGVARGYTLAEIIGEKWVEGGVLQWKGIRGGTREATYERASSFGLTAHVRLLDGEHWRTGQYRIVVEIDHDRPPRVVEERLVVEGRGQFVFDSHPKTKPPEQDDPEHLHLRLKKEAKRGWVGPALTVLSHRPAITQLLERDEGVPPDVRELVDVCLDAFRSMRFLGLHPDAMRTPSLPGQYVLGDRGENLASVLHAICARPPRKETLIEWLRELTPLDVVDFEFPADATGRVLLMLVEEGGRKTSAYSASDGTLRFLALIAAFLGPEPAHLYFFEELETGLHPSRLHLLIDLVEGQTRRGVTQVIATTHSPHLLGLLSKDTLRHTTLAYRLRETKDQRLIPILEIPQARKVLSSRDAGTLHASGWLEDAVEFAAAKDVG